MKSESISVIAETIIRLRTENGLTQQELADRLMVSRSLVSMWELGIRTPDLLSVEQMAELFGVEKSAVVPDERYVFAGGEFETITRELYEITAQGKTMPEGAGGPESILDAFLSKQSQKNKALFISRYLMMKTFKTIAEEFGINESTARSRIARLRSKFRQFISGEESI